MDPSINDRDPSISDRDLSITDRDPSITDRDPSITDRDPSITDRDPAITDSFGKRTAGCARRVNDCLTLEASEMIVIDYPDVTLMTQPQSSTHNHHHHTRRKYNAHNSHNIERLLAATSISNHDNDTKVAPPTVCHTRCKSDSSVQLPVELQGVHNMLQKSEHLLMLRSETTTSLPTTTSAGTPTKRHSRASDTSSAYSGSDMTTQSLSVAGDDPDIDLSCLRESSVDSDDDENLDATESLIVRDTVRECLEKDPAERTEDDIEVLLDFLQHLLAFANMTLATRRALCAVMVFAVVDKAGTVVMKDREELDSWSVILNGHVEVTRPDGTIEHLHMGDSFGITPTMEKLYHSGVMRTKIDDCQFVCIAQSDYYNILHQGEENTRRHKEGDEVVLVTEHRVLDGGNRKGYIVIRGTVDRLINHLVEQHSAVDPTYVEDFLLTYRAFLKSPQLVAEKLLVWFSDPKLRDRVTRVVLLWVNNHFNDFEMQSEMTDFLEKFEQLLEKEHMGGQLRLLNIACAAKAKVRTVVVTRTTRQEILHFSVLGGLERGCGIFISKVEPGSKAQEAGLKRGDQILEVNNHNFEHISHHRALEVLRGTTHLSINVKSNLLAFKEMLVTPDNSPGHKRKREQIAKLQNDPRQRLSASDLDQVSIVPPFINKPGRERGANEKKERRFMSTGHKAKIRKALMRMNLLPRSGSSDSQLTNYDDTSLSSSSSLSSTQYYKRSISANSSPLHTPHLSASNPDLTSLGQYVDTGVSAQPDYPEHVLKVYRADQSYKYFLVHRVSHLCI
ncbi:Rap guanine nucleotide exchange factor 2 [Lamellibrachia satsuma]|nr:Rap guanine nucleotide exchange factor 2 [Lamellibrachia satsuma]